MWKTLEILHHWFGFGQHWKWQCSCLHHVSALRGVQYAMRSQRFALLFRKCPPLACLLLAPLVSQLCA